MRLTTSIVISGLTLLAGVLFKQEYIWIPAVIFISGIIEIYTRDWIASDRVGTNPRLSIYSKVPFMIIGMIALLGQIVCVGLFVFWFIQ